MSDAQNDTASRPTGSNALEPIKPALGQLSAGSEALPIIPRTLEDVMRYANWIIDADMVPDSYVVEPTKLKVSDFKDLNDYNANRDKRALQMTRGRIMIGIEAGLEVGMGPVTAMKSIMIVNNRPSVWGDGLVALCQRNGQVSNQEVTYINKDGTVVGLDKAEAGELAATPKMDDEFTCVVKLWRKGQPNPYVGKFSVRDARRAGLWGNTGKKPWIQYPLRMLKARAQAFALRDGFADCILGLHVAEEQMDIEPAAKPAAVTADFLDDAPQPQRPAQATIEHSQEQPMNQNLGSSTERTPEAVVVGAAGGGEAAAPSGPATPPPAAAATDWPAWIASVTSDINACNVKADFDALMDKISEPLSKAPPVVQGQTNRLINDRKRQLRMPLR